MGQQNSSQSLCQTTNKSSNKGTDDLAFYITVQDRQFGQIPVYTSTKKPSCYIAKVSRFIQNSRIYNFFQQVQNSQLSHLASLHAFQIKRQKYLTGSCQQKITAFWEYCNYSFQDFLKMRFLKRIPFSENQLWLIIKACCESFSLLNFYGLILDLDLKHITVIPEGKVKIYWHQVQLDNSHLHFYRKIREISSRRNSIQSSNGNRQFRFHEEKDQDTFFFSPEQIEGIEKRQQTLSVDFAKANSFRLGMLILYCITLTNPIKTCYSTINSSGVRKIKTMVLNSLYQSKIQNSSKYSQSLKHLIKILLLQDPSKRIPLTCLQNIYQQHMDSNTQLKMGMTDNPLYAPSSSRKKLREDDRQHDGFIKNLEQRNQQKPHKKHSSKFQSENIIQQSRVRSCDRDRQEQQVDSRISKEHEPFDKFDTKTIKISSSYHNNRKQGI